MAQQSLELPQQFLAFLELHAVASLPQQDLASPEPQHDFPSFAQSLASIPLQQSMEALASLESLPQQAIALASFPLQQAMSDWLAAAGLFLSVCAL